MCEGGVDSIGGGEGVGNIGGGGEGGGRYRIGWLEGQFCGCVFRRAIQLSRRDSDRYRVLESNAGSSEGSRVSE